MTGWEMALLILALGIAIPLIAPVLFVILAGAFMGLVACVCMVADWWDGRKRKRNGRAA